MKKILFLALAAALFTLSAFPTSAADVSGYINGIIAYKACESGAKSNEEWAEKLAQSAGTGAEWYIMYLHQTGEYDFTEYASSLAKYLSENSLAGTEGLRCALGFIAANHDSVYIDYAAENFIGAQGIMSYIWGLHLLNNRAESSVYTAESLAEKIAEMRLSDGGFALSGDVGNVDVTAMAISALAPYYAASESVRETVYGAIEFLSSAQRESGGFSSYGTENCESAAQVVVALCALGIDPTADERFIKNGKSVLDAMCTYALPSGAFSHTTGGEKSDMATSQALYAFIAYERMKEGKGSFFIFDVQENATPADFADVNFKSETPQNGENDKNIDVKTVVCVSVIAVCAVGIAITVFLPKKKIDK